VTIEPARKTATYALGISVAAAAAVFLLYLALRSPLAKFAGLTILAGAAAQSAAVLAAARIALRADDAAWIRGIAELVQAIPLAGIAVLYILFGADPLVTPFLLVGYAFGASLAALLNGLPDGRVRPDVSPETIGAMMLGAAMHPFLGAGGVLLPLVIRALGLVCSAAGLLRNPKRGFYVTAVLGTFALYAAVRWLVWNPLRHTENLFYAGFVGIIASVLLRWTAERIRRAPGAALETAPVVVALAVSYALGSGMGIPGGGLYGVAIAAMGLLATSPVDIGRTEVADDSRLLGTASMALAAFVVLFAYLGGASMDLTSLPVLLGLLLGPTLLAGALWTERQDGTPADARAFRTRRAGLVILAPALGFFILGKEAMAAFLLAAAIVSLGERWGTPGAVRLLGAVLLVLAPLVG